MTVICFTLRKLKDVCETFSHCAVNLEETSVMQKDRKFIFFLMMRYFPGQTWAD